MIGSFVAIQAAKPRYLTLMSEQTAQTPYGELESEYVTGTPEMVSCHTF